MGNRVVIYGKSGCPYTQKAIQAYGERAQYVDVLADRSRLREMLSYSKGLRKVPVIVDGESVSIGWYGGA